MQTLGNNVSRPVFVVSTGRTGSQMIARTLAKLPGVCALHEPRPQLYAEAFASWSGARHYADLVRRVSNKRRDWVEQIQANGYVYLESSHFLSHLIPHLEELFSPKFVFIHRDCASFVSSGLIRNWYPDGASWPGHVAKRWVRRHFLLDVGTPGDEHRLRPPRGLASRAEKIAWLWSEINGIILEALSPIPRERQLALRLNDLSSKELAGLVEFIGVEADVQTIEALQARSASRPNRSKIATPELSASVLKRVDALSFEVSRRLAYA